MSEKNKLFAEEQKIANDIREISQGLLDLSDYALAKSPVELADVQVIGKRIRRACDTISDEVHTAKKILGRMMTRLGTVTLKGQDRDLHEVENELSLIHGDLEAIGNIAERYHEAEDRTVAFENLNKHYTELVKHVTELTSLEIV